MKILDDHIHEHDVPKTKCCNCGYEIDKAASSTFVGPASGPKPGDLTICIECAYVQAFDGNMNLRKLTAAEREISLRSDFIQKSRKYIKENRKGKK